MSDATSPQNELRRGEALRIAAGLAVTSREKAAGWPDNVDHLLALAARIDHYLQTGDPGAPAPDAAPEG